MRKNIVFNMGPWPDYDTITTVAAVATKVETSQSFLGFDLTWVFAAIAGFGLSLLKQTREILFRVVSLIIVNYNFEQDVGSMLGFYFSNPKHGFKRKKSGIRRFTLFNLRNKKLNKRLSYIFETFTQSFTLYWKNKYPLLIGYKTRYNDSSDNNVHDLTIRFIRGTFDIEDLLKSALYQYNEYRNNDDGRFFIRHVFGTRGILTSNDYKNNNEDCESTASSVDNSEQNGLQKLLFSSWDDIGEIGEKETLDNLALSPQALNAVNDFRIWKNYESWFRERGIPWKLGWLFYGPPGTGKTSLARVVGKDADMPIFSYDLSSMNNQDLITQWQKMLSYSPCIALIEDIDNTFNLRTNITGGQSQGVTFDCLLNCLDGITSNDGLLIIVTTNKIDCLDKALGIPDGQNSRSSRPGRIDKTILMGPPDESGRRKIATRILYDWPDIIEQVVIDGADDTGAQFQRRCCDVAEKTFKEKNFNDELKK